MIIEDLIRTGRLLSNGGVSPEGVLRMVSDVDSPQTRNFFQHVFVVELPKVGDGDLTSAVHRKQQWGVMMQPDPKKKKTVFRVDHNKSAAAPFVFPGGNPIHPQGVYGLAVFPMFERHLESFRADADNVKDFLAGRFRRCRSLTISESELADAGKRLFDRIIEDDPKSDGKTMGLIMVCRPSDLDSPYIYSDKKTAHSIGISMLKPGKSIEPDFSRMNAFFGTSKFAEGAEMGTRQGDCSICGKTGDPHLVSAYCKSWPWFLPTWTCPVSNSGDTKSIVEGIAIDETCYNDLNLGASYFGKIARPIDSLVTRELFSPVADREGQRTVSHKSIGDLPTIYGAALLLPILEATQMDESELRKFGERLTLRLDPQKNQGRLQQHVETVLGFNGSVPRNVDDSVYRLNLLYYSGDPSRGDIHLRTTIEDVIPSTLTKLVHLVQQLAGDVPRLCEAVLPLASEKQIAYHAGRMRFLPFVLARAYGGAYVWEQLQRLLRRKPLRSERAIGNVARRIASLVGRLPKTDYEIREEVLFYLFFLDFLQSYNQQLAIGETPAMTMRNWQELLKIVQDDPPEEMKFDSPSELAFACGVLIRQYSRRYWMATKVGEKGKDYLKHRVLTFGSSLSPVLVWKKALPEMFNLERKLKELELTSAFSRRIGILLSCLENEETNIRSDRDAFMAAFWSGYALQKSSKNDSITESANLSQPTSN